MPVGTLQQKMPSNKFWRTSREADADNADRGLNNSDILRKPNSIYNSFIIHSPRKIGDDRYEIYFVCASAHNYL